MSIEPTNRAGRRSAAKTARGGTAKSKVADATLDLDALEREQAPDPFSFVHEGRTFVLADPQEMDWRDIVDALGHPELFFRSALSDEDRKVFLSQKMPAWKLGALVKRYREHYGMLDPGELAALSR
jgi:hypothetical protein